MYDNGSLLFSVPFSVSDPRSESFVYYFPHLAFGGGFQTTLTYVNYAPQAVTCQTTFYSDSGGSLQVPFAAGPVSARTDNLAAGADVHVETTAGATDQLLAGWAQAQCTGPVKASLLFRVYNGSVAQGEAGVNATTVPATEFVTFAQTQTGIAYANPSTVPATVTVAALDSTGNALGQTAFTLQPNAHGQANVGPLLNLSSFTGSVQIASTAPIVSLSLNAEDFPVFSSLPPGDLPAGTPLATGKGGGGPTPNTLTMTSSETVGALITDTQGNTSFCSIPTPKVAFQTTDTSAGVWFMFNSAQPGDVLLVNWIHPSGAIDSYQPTTTLAQGGDGCYAWFLGIQGSPAASDPGAWQVKVLVNGATAFALPFFVGPITPPEPPAIASLSSTSVAPLNPLYIKTAGLNTSAPVQVTFSNSIGYSVTQGAIRVLSDGTVVAAVPIYADAKGTTSAASLSLTISQGAYSSPPVTVNVQDLPSVASYGTNPGDISRAFMNYQAMALAQRINELQALAALPGNTVDVSQQVSNFQTMLLNIISARNDVDRVSADNTTVINGGNLADRTPILFNAGFLDAMDRVLGAYLTQLLPYMQNPPPGLPAALSRKHLRRSPIAGIFWNGRLRARGVPPQNRRTVGNRSSRPLLSSPFSSVKSFMGWLTTATNEAGAAATYQAWVASGEAPPGMEPDQNLLDAVSAVAGGMSGVLGFYSQTLEGPKAYPAAAASALLGAISGGASLLNDFGHELGAFAYVLTAGDNGDPAVLADAWQEINSRGAHAGIDAVQTELSLFTYGINAEGNPLYSSALNTFGANFANWMQASAQSETGALNGGLQALGLWANYQAFLLDGGLQTLNNIDASLESEASKGAISLMDAFGEVVGTLDISYPSTEFPPLSGLDLSSDDSDEFDSMAGVDGDFVVYVPLGDPNFDYANAVLSAVDPLSGDAVIGSANMNLSNLNSQSPSSVPPISGTCIDDDAGDPDSDDPDCDNLGWIPSFGNYPIYLAAFYRGSGKG